MQSNCFPTSPLFDLVKLVSFLDKAEEIATSASLTFFVSEQQNDYYEKPIQPDHDMNFCEQNSFTKHSHKQMSHSKLMKTNQCGASAGTSVVSKTVELKVEDEPLVVDEAIFSHMIPGSFSSDISIPPERSLLVSSHYISECSSSSIRFHKSQPCQWEDRFHDLLLFQQEHGHLLVPHCYPPNPKLAQWVKRQRRQYKRKKAGKHSTLTDEREEKLLAAGFIFD
ncbi:helicase domain protein [Nitzschia inconspicua]|uniref:Helicase domain protein n=1 Tax=Nitzschia inconspicua TaxID=303405 RepID=A0A9K3Q9B5_9STRA|nr:helicase domain protein [Nitzschia inconspicua]